MKDMHSRVAEKNLTERALVHELRGVIAASGTHQLESEHALDLASALPEELPTSGMSQLAAYYQHRKRAAD